MEIVKIKDFCFKYPTQTGYALKDINLSVKQGEFVVLFGNSGCGKTTLLRALKREITPAGELGGTVKVFGSDVSRLDKTTSVSKIGFVFQSPQAQIATDKVYSELAFVLESLSKSTEFIRRKVAETASFFGIEKWFRSDTDHLSGGQKQIVNLASVMMGEPDLLLLDEPTSQLDPISAGNFFDMLLKINKELGITVILSEHRLENLLDFVDKIAVMNGGKLEFFGTPEKCSDFFAATNTAPENMPQIFALNSKIGENKNGFHTIKGAREFLQKNYKNSIKNITFPAKNLQKIEKNREKNEIIELKNVNFEYKNEVFHKKNHDFVLEDVNLKIKKGEVFALLGANGAGKTTLIDLISGLLSPDSGRIKIEGKSIKSYKNNSLYVNLLSYLPQNPSELLSGKTVGEDFDQMVKAHDVPTQKVEELVAYFDAVHLLSHHPLDLSGGEQQKCALIKILLANPKIIILDEPTKGLDIKSKQDLCKLIKRFKKEGKTILLVTHDTDFVAECADRCALIFDKHVISESGAREFFCGNSFYTTTATKISKGFFENSVTIADIARLCEVNGRND